MNLIKVMLDPGHGGSDRANKGPTGYVEADGVLDISLKVKKKLLSTGRFDVKLTREKDMTLGLTERGQMAARWGAQLFISEHTNATGKVPNKTVRGVAVYESVDLPDEAFAEEMAKAIAEAVGIPNRGGHVRESQKYPGEDYYTVIDAAQDGGVPHVLLIESAFHDNIQDEAILKDPAKRDLIAEAQVKVICKKFGVVYPAPAKEVKPMENHAFKDLVNEKGQTHFAAKEIDFFAAKGLVKGDANGNFNPDAPLTRGQACALFYRILKEYELIKE
jgi:N-acetylmuramoyl-L-alanine amidase